MDIRDLNRKEKKGPWLEKGRSASRAHPEPQKRFREQGSCGSHEFLPAQANAMDGGSFVVYL